jgi:hypothetical protein
MRDPAVERRFPSPMFDPDDRRSRRCEMCGSEGGRSRGYMSLGLISHCVDRAVDIKGYRAKVHGRQYVEVVVCASAYCRAHVRWLAEVKVSNERAEGANAWALEVIRGDMPGLEDIKATIDRMNMRIASSLGLPISFFKDSV